MSIANWTFSETNFLFLSNFHSLSNFQSHQNIQSKTRHRRHSILQRHKFRLQWKAHNGPFFRCSSHKTEKKLTQIIKQWLKFNLFNYFWKSCDRFNSLNFSRGSQIDDLTVLCAKTKWYYRAKYSIFKAKKTHIFPSIYPPIINILRPMLVNANLIEKLY